MRMGEIEIHDYARQLLEVHGDLAIVEAAQKACACEERVRRSKPKSGGISKQP